MISLFPQKIEKLLVMTKSLDEPPTSKYRFYRDLYTQIFIYGEYMLNLTKFTEYKLFWFKYCFLLHLRIFFDTFTWIANAMNLIWNDQWMKTIEVVLTQGYNQAQTKVRICCFQSIISAIFTNWANSVDFKITFDYNFPNSEMLRLGLTKLASGRFVARAAASRSSKLVFLASFFSPNS